MSKMRLTMNRCLGLVYAHPEGVSPTQAANLLIAQYPEMKLESIKVTLVGLANRGLIRRVHNETKCSECGKVNLTVYKPI